MICICPYQDCHNEFALDAEAAALQKQTTDRFAQAICLHCGRACVARPADLMNDLRERRANLADRPFAQSTDRLVVVLDDMRSLHNVGAVFRTADATSFSHVFMAGITGVPPRKEIAKVSLGSEDWIPYSYSLFVPDVLDRLKAMGYFVVALERNQNSRSLSQAIEANELKAPLALVVGNEVTGVSIEALSMCDAVCHLNMRGRKESLNASVAFGIAAYLLSEAFN